jgi:Tfp pilus assembly ATPase PilU
MPLGNRSDRSVFSSLPFDDPVFHHDEGKLTREKNDLANEVELKSNGIRKKDKEIVEKERDVREAIEESNRLRLKIDAFLQQDSKAMVKNKE